MTWPTPKHLHLTYETRHGTYVVFQAVRVEDVNINVSHATWMQISKLLAPVPVCLFGGWLRLRFVRSVLGNT